MDAQVGETLAWLGAFDLSRRPDVEGKARLLLLDTIACAAAGFAVPEIAGLIELLAREEPGAVRWPGMARALSPSAAAYVGAMAACWHEACEGLARAHGRPGLHAIAPALCLALAEGAPLERLLDAIVWGYELAGRFGEAMRIRPGMHVDGCWGALGSAAAAARIRGGGAGEVRNAMALAACQIPTSLYLPVKEGSNARNTYAGHAAAMAIFYSATARCGGDAPAGAFREAARFIVGDAARAQWPWAPTGEFLILQAYLKPFAAVRHVHYPVQCALEWRQLGIDPQRITGVVIDTYQEALTYCGNRAPRAPIQAQFSLSYGTAYALSHGDLGPDAYTVQSLCDPSQQRLEAVIRLRADPNLTARGARLTVCIGNESWTGCVHSVAGDPDRPFTRAEGIEKANRFLAPVTGTAQASAIIRAILDGDRAKPIGW